MRYATEDTAFTYFFLLRYSYPTHLSLLKLITTTAAGHTTV